MAFNGRLKTIYIADKITFLRENSTTLPNWENMEVVNVIDHNCHNLKPAHPCCWVYKNRGHKNEGHKIRNTSDLCLTHQSSTVVMWLAYLRVFSLSLWCLNQIRHLFSAPILPNKEDRQTWQTFLFYASSNSHHLLTHLYSAQTHLTSTPEMLSQVHSVLATYNSPCWVRLLLLRL